MPDEPKTDDNVEPKGDEQLKLVAQNLDSMNKLVTGLMQKVAKLEDTSAPVEDEPADPPVLDAAGLEEMSRADFAKAMMGQFQAGIDQLDKRFSNQVSKLDTSIRNVDGKTQIKEARRDHKDFDDWWEDMKGLSGRHPTMTAEELYTTARAANPERAKELDTKYQPPEEKTPSDGNGAKDGKPTNLFGGLQPSNIETPEKPDNMTFETAAEKAWQDSMVGLNDVLNSS